jgi:hypothetical protein
VSAIDLDWGGRRLLPIYGRWLLQGYPVAVAGHDAAAASAAAVRSLIPGADGQNNGDSAGRTRATGFATARFT